MKKNQVSTILFMICSLTSLSQNLEFVDSPKYVAQKSELGKAFEVKQQQIVAPTYEKGQIINPEYVARYKLIDSLQGRIKELQSNNFGRDLNNAIGISSKKNAKEIEIENLQLQVSTLKKDVQPKNTSSTYTYAIPKNITGYVRLGESSRDILVIEPTVDVSKQLETNVFTEELSDYGGGNLYRKMKKDSLFFKKNELVVEESIRKYFGRDGVEILSSEAGYLYKRENDNSIFLFDVNFKKDLVEQKEFAFSKLLSELGINLENSDSHSNSVIVKNGKKCVLTSEIQEYLETKKNSDIIEKVISSVAMYKQNLKQQCDITVKMTKYIQIQKSSAKMTNQQRVEWEQLTKAAIVIEEKMKKIPFYDSLPYQLESSENQLHSANLDIILYSKQVLGI